MVPMKNSVQLRLRVVKLLFSHPTINSLQVSKLLKISREQATWCLTRLVDDGHLKITGNRGRLNFYQLDPDRLDVLQAAIKFYLKEEQP